MCDEGFIIPLIITNWINIYFLKSFPHLLSTVVIILCNLIPDTHMLWKLNRSVCYRKYPLQSFRLLVILQVGHSGQKRFRQLKAAWCWCVMDLSALMDFQHCHIVCPATDNRKLSRRPCSSVCVCSASWSIVNFLSAIGLKYTITWSR